MTPDYANGLLTLIAIYGILAMSVNIVVGLTSNVTVAQGIFFAIGAYLAAALAKSGHADLAVNIPAAFLLGGVSGMLLLCLGGVRNREKFMLTSFCIQLLGEGILINTRSLTGGTLGMANIPRSSLFGVQLSTPSARSAACAVSCLCAMVIAWNLSRSPLGRILRAVREHPDFAEAIGKNSQRAVSGTVMVATGLASAAGVLYADYVRFIDPTSFSLQESFLILSMAIIGGLDSVLGPLLGAALMVALPEAIRLIGVPSSVAPNVRQMIYCSALLFVLILRPRGLSGGHEFRR